MTTEVVTSESFARLLDGLSSSQQEEVLFEAGAHIHYLRGLEKLKRLKVTHCKFAVAVPDDSAPSGWRLEERDDLRQAAASRKALMAGTPSVEVLIINDAGDILDDDGNATEPSFYEN